MQTDTPTTIQYLPVPSLLYFQGALVQFQKSKDGRNASRGAKGCVAWPMGLLIGLLSMGVQFRISCPKTFLSIWKIPPEEPAFINLFRGASIADSSVNSDAFCFISHRFHIIVAQRQMSDNIVALRVDMRGYERIAKGTAISGTVFDHRLLHGTTYAGISIKQGSLGNVINNIRRTVTEVVQPYPSFQTMTRWIRDCGVENGYPKNQQEWPVGMKRGLRSLGSLSCSFLHFPCNADQLIIEDRNRNGCGGHHSSKKYRYSRIRIAIVAIAATIGTCCICWGLRRIGACQWRWVIIGWLLYESAGFIWFRSDLWNWILRITGGA